MALRRRPETPLRNGKLDKETRQRLLDRYNALDRNERQKLDKRAREMRSRSIKPAVRDRRAYDEDDAPVEMQISISNT